MMQGITALPGAQQGPQAQQAPGQATPFQALPAAQPKTPASEIAPYEGMDLQRLVAAFQQRPSGPLLGLITKKAEAEKLRQRMAQQQVIGAYAQQGPQTVKDMALANAIQAMRPTQTARHGGIMHGYAGGGAVAFEHGGRVQKFADGTDEDGLLSRFPEGSLLRRLYEWRKAGKPALDKPLLDALLEKEPERPPVAPGTENYSHESRVGLTSKPTPPTVAPPLPAPAPTQPRANRPGTGMAAAPAPAAAPTPAKPDKLSQIEEEYEAANKGLQALLQRQGQVDPELARLRQAAYESAQGITERRERDRLAALEAAQKATGAPLLENQEALLRMAASLGGAKRFGEALSRAAGAAGEVRGEQRKALEAAQKVSREEQNAIDQLNQALAEKRVADRSGDVDRQRQAELAVEQAKTNLADKRLGVQKERGTEEDRAAQRDLQRRQIEATLQAARIGAAARAEGMADPRKIYDTIIDNVQKEYDQWAKTVDGVRATPEQQAAKRKALLEQQVRIASAAGVKGLEALLAAGAAPPPAAPPLTGWGKATEVK